MTTWSLVGLDMLTKNPVNRDAFTYKCVVSGFLAIDHLAIGGNFVSIKHVPVGTGLGAIGLLKKQDTGSILAMEL